MTGALVPTSSHTLDRVTSPQVRGLVTAWLGSYSSTNTRAAYAVDMREWLGWLDSHDVDPLAVMRPHVDAWARSMEAAGLRPTTRARRLAAVSAFYAYAEGLGAVSSNPAASVRRPRTGEGYVTLTPSLSRTEVDRLLTAAAAPQDRALVVILATLALRVSEAMSLDLDAVERVDGHATLVVHGKGGREDRMPLPPLVLDALDRLGRTSGPVFLDVDGQRMSRHSAARALTRLGRAAGLDRHLTPHVLRASAVTIALAAGVPLHVVQDLARHSDPRTTRRYDRNRRALDGHAAYALGALLAEPVSA